MAMNNQPSVQLYTSVHTLFFFYHQANKETPDEDKMAAYYYEICLQCRIKTNLSLFVTMTDLNTDCCCVYCTLLKNVENYFVPNFIEVVERTGC